MQHSRGAPKIEGGPQKKGGPEATASFTSPNIHHWLEIQSSSRGQQKFFIFIQQKNKKNILYLFCA